MTEENMAEQPDDNQEIEKNSKIKRNIKEIFSWIGVFAGAFVVAYLLSNYIIINARIPSRSMENTIKVGDKVIGLRHAYVFSEPKRGDIIMFKAPNKENTIYIKRIIGLPGDRIVIDNNKIYINGSEQPYEEKYVTNEWNGNGSHTEYIIPEGEYFLMGDNRDNSSDSRVWGTIKKKDIIAKAVFRYYPKIKLL